MKKGTMLIVIAATTALSCADAADETHDGLTIADAPSESAIEEPGEAFRPYANLTVFESGTARTFSFHLDELEDERAAYRGCSGETFSLCGGILAYCDDGRFLDANSGSLVPGGNRCYPAPDEWHMHRLVNCPLGPRGYVSVDVVTSVDQASYSQPAVDYLGEPVVVPGVDGTSSGDQPSVDSSTDGTTQPGGDSSSDSSDATSTSQQRERPSGSSPTSQPGQL
jgi:hypothetical protein